MRVVAVVFSLLITACGGSPFAPGASSLTVGPGRDFATIQQALDAASPGATITVVPGVYRERIVVAKAVTLRGSQSVLDGLAAGLDGRDVGIDVRSSHVEITGFIIQNFERGIVVENASEFRLRQSEIRNNTSKDPPPIPAGVAKSDGIVLFGVQDSEVSDNFIHDNGSIGLWLGQASNGNTVRGNRFVNNGTQQGLPGSGFSGGAIVTGGLNNTRNEFVDNDISGGYWGIRIGGSPDSANVVRNNRVHGTQRAGIAVYGQHNRIEGNNVSGSGLLNMPPSCRLDMMDHDVVDNDWVNNSGTFGTARPFGGDPCS